ncbi:hypothetical protein J1N35_045716, partial [Gossypium stocksii]
VQYQDPIFGIATVYEDKSTSRCALEHGESFCLIRVRVDPSQIVFGWDITLQASTKGRSTRVNRWLR